jgi:hypothetical protein
MGCQMQTEKLVDVFVLTGRRIGRYRVNLAGSGDEKLAEGSAIEAAIREGDAGESDRSRMVAVVRKPATTH